MSQHDHDLANQSRTAFRGDLNNALLAIVSQNSGATAPSTTYAYQWWADTTTGLLKQRNAANSAWITIGTLADAYLGLASLAASSLFTGAGNTFQGRLNTASSVGGTVDAITATHSPAFTAWVDKMRGTFRAGGANATTTPTFAPDGLAAKTFVKENLAALAASDIAGAGHEVNWIYNATADKVLLLNPKVGALSSKVVNTSYDVSVIGALAITGAGFTPRAAYILANITGTKAYSWGFIDSAGGTTDVFSDAAVNADVCVIGSTTVYIRTGSGNDGSATWASWDADGVTLTRAKGGTPTGTVDLRILFIK